MAEQKFKVGDKVRVIQSGYGLHPDDIGCEVIISIVGFGEYINNKPCYKFDLTTAKMKSNYGYGSYGRGVNSDWVDGLSFELVEAENDVEDSVSVPYFKIEHANNTGIHTIMVQGKLSQETVMAIYNAIHENRVA